MQDTRPLIFKGSSDFPSITRGRLTTLQVNLGYKCNLSCTHCHVNAGPTRTEQMDRAGIELVLGVIEKRQIQILDLTGGAPELNPGFKELVVRARAMGVKVIDRCNLTVLEEPGQEGMAEFLAQQQVAITASLPCYSLQRVDSQRGKGTFDASIRVLRKLNGLGYGKRDSELQLDLVFNPQGPNLPPPQQALEKDYRKELRDHFDIEFNNLLTLTNMPISRFGAVLLAKNQFESYMNLLRDNYSEQNLDSLMCKTLVSVDWQGYLYDCDFNQMLGMGLGAEGISGENVKVKKFPKQSQKHLSMLLNDDLQAQTISVADHCFGCTAGQGSSCGGALSDD